MHKVLLLLGILLRGPLYGYELHRIVRAHGELYADLKKANLYYLLERLASEGHLTVHSETGTRGARGERLIYEITEQGQTKFITLLQEILLTYEPVHTGIETAIVFLKQLPPAKGLELLAERRQIVARRRNVVAAEMGDPEALDPLARIAVDHLLSLVDAELAWLDRSIIYLRQKGWTEASMKHTQQRAKETPPDS